jgi:hypothetical protein
MTNQTTALAVREISLNTWQTIQAIAPTMRSSGLFGVASEAAAASIMLKGYELGMGLTAAFEHIHVIEGKTSLSPRGALALVLQSPLCAGIDIEPLDKPIGCKVTAKRVGGMTFTSIFTLEDAKTADLIKPKSGWEKYPRQMCQWRAVGYALDVVFPDVIGGLKRADELGADLTAQGDVIEGSWTVAQPVSQPEPVSVAKPRTSNPEYKKRFAELMTEFDDIEAIKSANGGEMPKTLDEVEQVFTYLKVQSVPFDQLAPLPY